MDVSIVIPTHNSSGRLATTLEHIAAQRPPPGLTWEVIVIDNASTDGTGKAAMAAWPPNAPLPLRIVREPQLGLGHAHVRGFAEAKGRLVSWVEDDNWISPDWLEVVSAVMARHPEVGACGSYNQPVCEIAPPAWFETFQSAYATGPQGADGQVSDTRGYLWGAGLTVRKEAWDHLVQNGFRPLLADRQGSAGFNSGGDSEICFALRLTGWRLWFEPRLRLRHFLFAPRLEWSYLRGLFRGVGASTVGFDPYLRALRGTRPDGQRRAWAHQARPLVADLAKQSGKVWRSRRNPSEGDASDLELESKLGRLGELLRRRGAYDRSLREIESAPWRSPA